MIAAEYERLKGVIERDRSQCADILSNIKKAIMAREWLRLGRGSYEWDDDRWMSEFGAALEEILEAAKPLAKIAADWSDCPTRWDDIQRARTPAAVLSPDRQWIRGHVGGRSPTTGNGDEP